MIQEKLQAALNNKELNNYIWKYAKQTINNEVMQPIKKLVDMTEPELKSCVLVTLYGVMLCYITKILPHLADFSY